MGEKKAGVNVRAAGVDRGEMRGTIMDAEADEQFVACCVERQPGGEFDRLLGEAERLGQRGDAVRAVESDEAVQVTPMP